MIIDPFPPIIDACEQCGAFKCVSYIETKYICHDCIKNLEVTDEAIYDNLDN